MDSTALEPVAPTVAPPTVTPTAPRWHVVRASAARRWPWAVVAALTAVGAGVRLWVPRGLWLDEATSWVEASQPFHRMLEILQHSDVHPPGYLAALWVSVRVIGDGELALRAPSILAGVLLVPVLYVVGRDLYDRRAGLVAATLGVIAPQMVWYSQEARMYAFFQLFAVLAVWTQVLAIRRGRWWHWAGYTLATAALLYTQYFTVLVVVVQQVAFLVVAVARRRRREPVGRYLLGWATSAVAVLALVAPLVPFAWQQFVNNQDAGRGFGAPTAVGGGESPLSYYTVVANLIWAVWGYHAPRTMTVLGALWPLALLLTLLLLGRGRSRVTNLLVAVAFVPVAALYVVALHKRFLFDLRYFSAIVPVSVLLIGRAVSSWTAQRAGRVLLAAAVFGSLAWGTVDEQLNHANPRIYDFKGALHFVSDHARPGDRLYFAPVFLNNLCDYYAPRVPSEPFPGRHLPRVPAGRRVFVLVSFLDKASTRQVVDQQVPRMTHQDRLVQTFHSANVRVWEFSAP